MEKVDLDEIKGYLEIANDNSKGYLDRDKCISHGMIASHLGQIIKELKYLRSENEKLWKVAEAASDVLPYLKDNNTLRARQIESALKEWEGE